MLSKCKLMFETIVVSFFLLISEGKNRAKKKNLKLFNSISRSSFGRFVFALCHSSFLFCLFLFTFFCSASIINKFAAVHNSSNISVSSKHWKFSFVCSSFVCRCICKCILDSTFDFTRNWLLFLFLVYHFELTRYLRYIYGTWYIINYIKSTRENKNERSKEVKEKTRK